MTESQHHLIDRSVTQQQPGTFYLRLNNTEPTAKVTNNDGIAIPPLSASNIQTIINYDKSSTGKAKILTAYVNTYISSGETLHHMFLTPSRVCILGETSSVVCLSVFSSCVLMPPSNPKSRGWADFNAAAFI